MPRDMLGTGKRRLAHWAFVVAYHFVFLVLSSESLDAIAKPRSGVVGVWSSDAVLQVSVVGFWFRFPCFLRRYARIITSTKFGAGELGVAVGAFSSGHLPLDCQLG
ncbi:hypothetical protein B0H19DRAFT_1244454 [Mycena capillaripes]|nr:hypothetical protein B0H19DRAFT_1244454 [Mycena capillaripes]